MHVLLDARTILGPKTGDRTYWLGLLDALPREAPDWQFTAALDGQPEPGLVPDRPNLDVAVVFRPHGRLWTMVALPKLARRLGVDLVHLQYVGPPWLPCPFVTTVHDCSYDILPATFTRRDRLWLHNLVPWTARRAAAVVGVSETTRQDLIHLYELPAERVFAAPNGISPFYHPASPERVATVRERHELPDEYLLSVGVLQPRKNLPGLVLAYERARQVHGLDVPLIVVGKKGWLYEEVFHTVMQHNLQDHVRFIGYVPDEDLPALYTGAMITLYPSLYEGFGLPPLESLACGTPTIVSDAPALVEVLADAAPHLPADDPMAWAQSMARLAGDADERARLAELGRARVAGFTWERSAHSHLEAYRCALGETVDQPG